MQKINDGGPAFPADPHAVAGMTLRDYFATKAMQGILADRENVLRFHEIGETELVSPESLTAAAAYQMADAAIKEADA